MEALLHFDSDPYFAGTSESSWSSFGITHATFKIIKNIYKDKRTPALDKTKLVQELISCVNNVAQLTSSSLNMIRDAQTFIYALPKNCVSPGISISRLGSIGIYWDIDDLFIDVLFTGSGKISYYINSLQGEFLGDDQFISFATLPKDICANIPLKS